MRRYDMIDIELCKKSPWRSRLEDWLKLAEIEWYFHEKRQMPPPLNTAFHIIVRSCMRAFIANNLECPWVDDYTRLPKFDKGYVDSSAAKPTITEAIMDFMSRHPVRARTGDIVAAVVLVCSCSPASVNVTVAKLVEDKLLIHPDHGFYSLVKSKVVA